MSTESDFVRAVDAAFVSAFEAVRVRDQVEHPVKASIPAAYADRAVWRLTCVASGHDGAKRFRLVEGPHKHEASVYGGGGYSADTHGLVLRIDSDKVVGRVTPDGYGRITRALNALLGLGILALAVVFAIAAIKTNSWSGVIFVAIALAVSAAGWVNATPRVAAAQRETLIKKHLPKILAAIPEMATRKDAGVEQ